MSIASAGFGSLISVLRRCTLGGVAVLLTACASGMPEVPESVLALSLPERMDRAFTAIPRDQYDEWIDQHGSHPMTFGRGVAYPQFWEARDIPRAPGAAQAIRDRIDGEFGPPFERGTLYRWLIAADGSNPATLDYVLFRMRVRKGPEAFAAATALALRDDRPAEMVPDLIRMLEPLAEDDIQHALRHWYGDAMLAAVTGPDARHHLWSSWLCDEFRDLRYIPTRKAAELLWHFGPDAREALPALLEIERTVDDPYTARRVRMALASILQIDLPLLQGDLSDVAAQSPAPR